jgi:hypothetical protein
MVSSLTIPLVAAGANDMLKIKPQFGHNPQN